MKHILSLLLCALLCLSLTGLVEKLESTPEIFAVSYKSFARKEDKNRYYLSKEYPITTNEAVAVLCTCDDGPRKRHRYDAQRST